MSYDVFDDVCENNYAGESSVIDSLGNVISVTPFLRSEEVDRDQCCLGFGLNTLDFELADACDFELEVVSEGNVFEDGLCKFVSQFLAKYNLSTGVTVF